MPELKFDDDDMADLECIMALFGKIERINPASPLGVYRPDVTVSIGSLLFAKHNLDNAEEWFECEIVDEDAIIHLRMKHRECDEFIKSLFAATINPADFTT